MVERQQKPDIEENACKEKMSCRKRTMYRGSRKVSVNFKTHTDKLNFVVYRYRNQLYFKDNEVDLNLSD